MQDGALGPAGGKSERRKRKILSVDSRMLGMDIWKYGTA